jgi:putative DNA primase/helicase
MSAASIGLALRGKKNGSGYLCRCPVPSHGNGRGDRNPSLSVSDGEDGRLLLKCFAGCQFDDIMNELAHRGLIDRGRREIPSRPEPRPIPKIEPDKAARDIWAQSGPIYGTIVEEYLQRRGILLTPPALCHYRGAMVASVTNPHAGITAIQRTTIDPDTLKRVDRMTKGPLGTGAVRLGAAQRMMGIAEGTETALSAMMLTGMPVWASLGRRMHSVELPPFVEEVHIFSDNDDPGRAAAERAREVHRDLGRIVKVRRPPAEFKDYNDFIVADADAWARG